MRHGKFGALIEQIRRASFRDDGGTPSDGELVKYFIACGDETAFGYLVRRHAAMVLAVCRRVLGNEHDAEDAFQATFLVLARKARSIVQRQQVGNWLYGVAYRTALHARQIRARQQAKEKPMPNGADPIAAQPDEVNELLPLLDKALNRLPERYRVAVVLCELEGRSRKAAADQLGIPEGTLSSRLAKARQLLARDLVTHVPTATVATVAALLAQSASASTVPAALVAAASNFQITPTAKVLALAEIVVRTMLLVKVKKVALGLLLASLLACAGVFVVMPVFGNDQPAGGEANQPAAAKDDPAEKGGEPKREEKKNGAVILTTEDKVLSLAFSPNGKLVVAGSGYDRTMRVWDGVTGKERDSLGKHPDFVHGVAFSPDGKLLAASGRTFDPRGTNPERVRIWDMNSGKEKFAFEIEPAKRAGSALPVLAFNPKDGNMLTVAGRGGLVHFWDIAAGKETKTLPGPVEFLTSIAFSPNGKLVAAGGRGKTAGLATAVIVWESATGKEVTRHDGPIDELINSLAFTPNGKLLVAGCSNGEIHIWDVETGWKKIIPRNLNDNVSYVAISSVPLPDGIGPKKEKTSRWLLAAADWNKQVRLLAIPSGEEIATLKGHDRAVMCVAFSPDGKQVVSGGWDNTVRLWRVPTLQPKAADGHSAPDQKIPVRHLNVNRNTLPSPAAEDSPFGRSSATVARNTKDLEKQIGAAAAKALAKQVDFGEEQVVVVSWTGSGLAKLRFDRVMSKGKTVLEFFVDEPPPDGAPRTLEGRLGLDFFAVPANTSVRFGKTTSSNDRAVENAKEKDGDKKDTAKDEIVVLDPNDFPIRVGPEIAKDKEDDAKRKEAACRKKYDGKLVKVASPIGARPAAKDNPQVYTLRITYAVKRGKEFYPAEMQVDFIPAKASPELKKESRSGLIAEVVGRCHMDAKGRLLLKNAKVLGTNVPPG